MPKWSKLKRQMVPIVGEEVESLHLSYAVGGDVNSNNHFGELPVEGGHSLWSGNLVLVFCEQL